MAQQEKERKGRRPDRERALQLLPDMLNQILVRTGKVSRDPARYAQRDGARGAPIAQDIQRAIEGFHGALDVLEIELLQARAALSQDLVDFRAKEAEAQRQSDAENQVEMAIPPPSSQEATEAAAPSAELQQIEHERNENNTVTITIEDDEPGSIAREAVGNLTKPTEDALRFSPVTSSPPPPLSEVVEISNPGKSNGVAVQQEERQPTDIMTSQASLQDEVSASTAPHEMDFDSMFPDITADTGTSGLDLDLNFSADSNLDHGTLVGQGFNMDSSATLKDPATTANDEMDALLPGLGSYASAVEDIGTMEIPMTITTNAATTSPTKANIDLSGPGISNNIESTNIDDLFADTMDLNLDDHGPGGDGTGSAFDVGAGGEFDDALFGWEGS